MQEMKVSSIWALLVLVPSLAFGQFDAVVVMTPRHFEIIGPAQGPFIEVSGRYEPPEVDPWLRVSVILEAPGLDCDNGAIPCTYNASMHQGRWSVQNVRLPRDVATRITASAPGVRDTVQVICCPDLVSIPRRTVGLEWLPGSLDHVRRVASKTLVPPPPAASIASFPAAIVSRVEALTGQWFEPLGIQLASPEASDVIVNMTAEEDRGFGRTDLTPDGCSTAPPLDRSRVNVGAFAQSMIDKPSYWQPMSPGDGIALRTEDLAWALAQTVIHEALHALGLVNCSWMDHDGIDPHHNPLGARWNGHEYSEKDLSGNGLHLMDSGLRAPGWKLLGEKGRTERGTRTYRRLNNLNMEYLTGVLARP